MQFMSTFLYKNAFFIKKIWSCAFFVVPLHAFLAHCGLEPLRELKKLTLFINY